MRRKITFLFGVALAIVGIFFISPQTKGSCWVSGAVNDGYCFGDIVYACLSSAASDPNCNMALSNEHDSSAEFE